MWESDSSDDEGRAQNGGKQIRMGAQPPHDSDESDESDDDDYDKPRKEKKVMYENTQRVPDEQQGVMSQELFPSPPPKRTKRTNRNPPGNTKRRKLFNDDEKDSQVTVVVSPDVTGSLPQFKGFTMITPSTSSSGASANHHERLQKQIRDLESRLGSLSKQYDEMQSRFDSVNERLNGFERSINEIKS